MPGANQLFELNQGLSDKPSDSINKEVIAEPSDLTAGGTPDATVRFVVPRDYNESTDRLVIHSLAELTSGTTTRAVTADSVTRRRAGAADATPSVDAQSQNVADGNPVAVSFDLSGLGLEAGDVVDLTIASDGDTVTFYGATAEYGGTIVPYRFYQR